MSEEKGEQVDEALYSRQLYVMGHEAQRKMQLSNILIVGLRGLGVEIAKNVILAGVKSVSLHDSGIVTQDDLGSQFYLTAAHVGTPRAEACVGRLAELNKYVKVTVATGKLDEALVSKYQVVVLTECLVSQQIKINDFCHNNNIKFISGDIRGVLGAVFTDFGSSHNIIDDNGERPLRGLISHVTVGNPGIVTCHEDSRHGLQDGNYVTFEEVEGMTQLNNCTPLQIKTINTHSFSIGDTSTFGQYLGTKGYFNQVKQPLVKSYKPLSQLINAPNILNDFTGEFKVHHCLYLAFSKFQESSNGQSLPNPTSRSDAEKVLELANQIGTTLECETKIDARIWLQSARCGGARLNPMAAFLGGIIGQEVLKAITDKFNPIDQFFYFDARTVLPHEDAYDWREYGSEGSRYQSQIAVIGNTLHEKLTKSSYFLVGAGAIGCEMIKNFAMMGLATCGDGLIHMTDMDTIEKSNLSRQFLFRESDVSQLKSKVAAREAVSMNQDLRINCKEVRVGAESENVYDDTFWLSLDGVCTALDNVDARLYVDTRCVYFQKPLIDSGTLGTKGNTQVIVPFLTESYGSSRDPPEEGIPICTLKHFPNKIEHTIQWARDAFEGYFNQGPAEVNNYLSDPQYLSELKKDPNVELTNLKTIKDYLVVHRPLSLEECVGWGRNQFESLFSNDIVQLLTTFPPDSNTESGAAFWSGPKRAPTPLVFNKEDPVHIDFVMSAANLRAHNYGLKGCSESARIKQFLDSVKVPVFVPNKAKKIAQTDEEAKSMAPNTSNSMTDDYDDQLAAVSKHLPGPASLAGYRLKVIEFEKDDDTNFHMDFITACSNLRARNYSITETTKHETKFIAGKIIPAIATTTALVTGLACLEVYKLVDLEHKKLEDFRNGYANLALPVFNFFEPVAPIYTTSKLRDGDWRWSLWDKIDIDIGDVTMQELIDHFEEKYGLEINMLSHGASMLYYNFNLNKKVKERLATPMSKVVESVGKKQLLPSERFFILEACCNVPEDDDAAVEIPYIRFKFR